MKEGIDAPKKRCFVVMGFGVKTDYATGRKLDLNKSYRLLIRPVVEQMGLECVRADEIMHSGTIDVPMYRELLMADVVIADLSTANVNAFYELGVRHALKPYTTVVISEDRMPYPFDLNHIRITQYTHLGSAIDFDEVERFRKALSEVLQHVLQHPEPDSPVYTFLDKLLPPEIADVACVPGQACALGEKGKALSTLMEEGEDAIDHGEFVLARNLFQAAVDLGSQRKSALDDTWAVQMGERFAHDPYLIHRLALCTYKAVEPDRVSSLQKALSLLDKLNLKHTNDAETVSMAGGIEKKLYECGQGIAHLEMAIHYFQRGFFLLNNRYNCINLAFTFNMRAQSELCATKDERVADMVYANYVRRRVLELCDQDMATLEKIKQLSAEGKAIMPPGEWQHQADTESEERFWIWVNRAESYFGLGDFDAYQQARNEAAAIVPTPWMMASFEEQITKLHRLLEATGHLLTPQWHAPDDLMP